MGTVRKKPVHGYDMGSKWMIQRHGDSILRLGGARDIGSWRALQAELVQSRHLPDGLIEVDRPHHQAPDRYVVEIYTYPDTRAIDQIVNDVASVYLDRKVLPEVIALFLHPKGRIEAAGAANLKSPQGWTEWRLSWKIIELWKVPADQLLAAGDVGLIPWVPLTDIKGAPEPILRQCRDRIERDASPDEQANLLAVTQVLARLRYNDERLFQLFGGRKAMIESPVLQELKAEWTQEAAREAARESTRKAILKFLEARFGDPARTLEAELRAVSEDKLDEVLKLAATCRSLAAFRKKLTH